MTAPIRLHAVAVRGHSLRVDVVRCDDDALRVRIAVRRHVDSSERAIELPPSDVDALVRALRAAAALCGTTATTADAISKGAPRSEASSSTIKQACAPTAGDVAHENKAERTRTTID